MKIVMIMSIFLVGLNAQARFSHKITDGNGVCPGSSQNCRGDDIKNWLPPADASFTNNGKPSNYMCCAYYNLVKPNPESTKTK